MGPNKAEHTLETRLVSTIQHLEREINALKTRQLFGGDNLPIIFSNEAVVDTGPMAPGDVFTILITGTPSVDRVMFANLEYSVFIFGTALPNADYIIPGGLAAGMDTVTAETLIHHREDHYLNELSDDIVRSHLISITNNQAIATRRFAVYSRFYVLGTALS